MLLIFEILHIFLLIIALNSDYSNFEQTVIFLLVMISLTLSGLGYSLSMQFKGIMAGFIDIKKYLADIHGQDIVKEVFQNEYEEITKSILPNWKTWIRVAIYTVVYVMAILKLFS